MVICSPNRALCSNTLKQQINLLYVDLIMTLILVETSPLLPSGLVCRNFKSGPGRHWLKESQLGLFKPRPSLFLPLRLVGSQPKALPVEAGCSWGKVHHWSNYVVNRSSVGTGCRLWLTPHSVTNNRWTGCTENSAAFSQVSCKSASR